MFLLGMAVLLFVEVTLFRRFGWAQFSKYNYGASLVGILIIASIVSWFGMAIPLIVSDDIGGWAALRKSFRLSNGYETFLSLASSRINIGFFCRVVRYALRTGPYCPGRSSLHNVVRVAHLFCRYFRSCSRRATNVYRILSPRVDQKGRQLAAPWRPACKVSPPSCSDVRFS